MAASLLGLGLPGCGQPEAGNPRFTAVDGGSAERGKHVIAHYQCGSCHAIPGVPSAAGRLAPSLQAFGKRSYIAGEVPNTPQALVRWLQDPQALVADTRMPDMGVTSGDARDMAAYLMTLR